jgi:hypothetical protein
VIGVVHGYHWHVGREVSKRQSGYDIAWVVMENDKVGRGRQTAQCCGSRQRFLRMPVELEARIRRRGEELRKTQAPLPGEYNSVRALSIHAYPVTHETRMASRRIGLGQDVQEATIKAWVGRPSVVSTRWVHPLRQGGYRRFKRRAGKKASMILPGGIGGGLGVDGRQAWLPSTDEGLRLAEQLLEIAGVIIERQLDSYLIRHVLPAKITRVRLRRRLLSHAIRLHQ